MEKTLLSVVGPTAIGKTKFAIELAQHYDTEIISADSRQFYKEMEIGTAVPDAVELGLAKHHFIQHKSIFEPYSVGDFERDALELLKYLFKKKDIVIMVGGSGLYVNSVKNGLDNFPKIDSEIRERLNEKLKSEGLTVLQEELKQKDLAYHKIVDLNNPHRVIRALEVCIGTGKPYSSFLSQKRKNREFRTFTIGLEADRKLVYHRIEKRVDKMIEKGLVEESKNLEKYKELNALQTVGYKELFSYFEGNHSLDFAISEIKKNTRRFAKRQITWFKKDKDIFWISHDTPLKTILPQLNQKL